MRCCPSVTQLEPRDLPGHVLRPGRVPHRRPDELRLEVKVGLAQMPPAQLAALGLPRWQRVLLPSSERARQLGQQLGIPPFAPLEQVSVTTFWDTSALHHQHRRRG